MLGYYRDDSPLYELVLDDAARREIDTLWAELHFITLDPMRQYKDFVFFERAEPPRFMYDAAFDFARSEDKDVTSAAKIKQLREAYLAKARKTGASARGAGGDRELFHDRRRADPPGGDGSAGRGTETSRRSREVRRARLPPTVDGQGTARTGRVLPRAAQATRPGARGGNARHAGHGPDVAALLLPH